MGSVPVPQWCLGDILVVSRFVSVVPWWCLGGASVVSRWCWWSVPVVLLARVRRHLLFLSSPQTACSHLRGSYGNREGLMLIEHKKFLDLPLLKEGSPEIVFVSSLAEVRSRTRVARFWSYVRSSWQAHEIHHFWIVRTSFCVGK